MNANSTLILNVDDNDGARYAKNRILQGAGYEVVEATNGTDALEMVKRLSPALVLLDVKLPDINGIDLHARLAAKHPTLPFVFSTGHGDALEVAAGSPTARFLRKPYTSDALLATLDDLLKEISPPGPLSSRA